MQELIMDLSGEFGADFQSYINSGSAVVVAEVGCETTVSCSTLGCTVIGCCLP